MQLLDGKKIAENIEQQLTQEVNLIYEKYQKKPILAVILVGDDPASQSYVRMKKKASERVGIQAILHLLSRETTQEELEGLIQQLNDDSNINGILVQLPLPAHLNTHSILAKISVHKDVDGFHPYNVGRVMSGLNAFIPATPKGIMTLLKSYNIPLRGKNVVIVGASNIVGKPLYALMLNAETTVCICHIYTKNLTFHTQNADIVCVGVGKPNLITAGMVKEGAIVIDIGINKLNHHIVGDVDFKNVSPLCSYITPVPGGVGPMTIISLLENTLIAFRQQN
ncbi:bifunctional methylenetetrahydrofolate dehydrogenase/methenyltetrahydrofolate cyclohydrolase [Helicobacter monodelphidis]|uniref:bifunctional methylenetetrahydrofolate dehydrogenase/methenyltetrahydrofolate cyclohydrolase FolD n=1 Tax=Helicobacter sp. 15-1451 TaxID=2004995 RepID=UPI000DCD7AA5|nr:bifunctional methylenetetrahydrofolate dehydrogenase/methenyltetrahydrofolate cyclohydrolase FolD [Helicobacter sp. 15-1451]RAX58141.1 bifunctional methylenetetrahydrofolate dehydrogenase/methenyltetrahydrofolate cyclohydrolase [Helicobacter sp. 15-1451]